MSDRLEGDIDLTQNLDFYRKKPPMLLPKNVNLSDINKNKINVDNSANTHININYNNIINIDYSSLYDSNIIVYDYQDTISSSTEISTNSSTTFYYRYNNDHQFRFNTFNRNNTTTSINISSGIKIPYNMIKEKVIKIWDHITNSEPKSIKTICSYCGKVISNPTPYKYSQCCKSCGSKKILNLADLVSPDLNFIIEIEMIIMNIMMIYLGIIVLNQKNLVTLIIIK